MKKPFVLFVLVFLFLIPPAVSQRNLREKKGYIVIKRDTVYGVFDLSNFAEINRSVRFSRNEGSQFNNLTPKDIEAFKIDDYGVFIAEDSLTVSEAGRTTTEVPVFLESMQSGAMELFTYRSKFKKDFFFVRQGGKFFQLIREQKVIKGDDGASYRKVDEKYKGVLNVFFGDCKSAADPFAVRFRKNDLNEFAISYNKCKDVNFRPRMNRNQRIYVGVMGGLSLYSIRFTDLNRLATVVNQGTQYSGYPILDNYTSKKDSYAAFAFGLSTDFSVGRSPNVAVGLDLIYSGRSGLSEMYSFSYRMIEIPFYGKLMFALSKPFRPYLGAGLNAGIVVDRELLTKPVSLRSDSFGPSPASFVPFNDGVGSSKGDHTTGAFRPFSLVGFDFFFKENQKIFVQARLESIDLSTSAYMDARMRLNSVFVGYSKRLE